MTRQLVNLTIEIVDLLLDGLARLEQRPDRSHRFGTIFDQPLGAHGEDIELGAADGAKTDIGAPRQILALFDHLVGAAK